MSHRPPVIIKNIRIHCWLLQKKLYNLVVTKYQRCHDRMASIIIVVPIKFRVLCQYPDSIYVVEDCCPSQWIPSIYIDTWHRTELLDLISKLYFPQDLLAIDQSYIQVWVLNEYVDHLPFEGKMGDFEEARVTIFVRAVDIDIQCETRFYLFNVPLFTGLEEYLRYRGFSQLCLWFLDSSLS